MQNEGWERIRGGSGGEKERKMKSWRSEDGDGGMKGEAFYG